MHYQTFDPPPRLAPYVLSFWVYGGVASPESPYIYRGYADGCTEMIFHVRSPFDLVNPDGTHEASIATGIHAQTRHMSRWVVKRDWSIFGCYLYPYAIPRLFGFPASDLTDRMIDFRSVLGVEGDELEERIMTAADDATRVRVLSAFLESRLDRNLRELPPVFMAINHILETRGSVSIDTLAGRFGMSSRHFERKFKEFSGFRPKLYSRIARFHAALKEYGSGKSLTDIAYDCGYYDQAHFISDFREFSGYSPKVYFSGRAEGSEYLEP
jgi:AraC-like DNA-binding protein